MPKISIINFIIGFLTIIFASFYGIYIAYYTNTYFAYDPSQLHGFEYVTMKSSHGHSNLFGTLHTLYLV